jgi:hypothetical protein
LGLRAFDVDLYEPNTVNINVPIEQIVIERNNVDFYDVSNAFCVVEKTWAYRARSNIGIKVIEILGAGPDYRHLQTILPRATGDIIGVHIVIGIEFSEPKQKAEILRHGFERMDLPSWSKTRERICGPVTAIGADVDEDGVGSKVSVEDPLQIHFMGVEEIFSHQPVDGEIDLILYIPKLG